MRVDTDCPSFCSFQPLHLSHARYFNFLPQLFPDTIFLYFFHSTCKDNVVVPCLSDLTYSLSPHSGLFRLPATHLFHSTTLFCCHQCSSGASLSYSLGMTFLCPACAEERMHWGAAVCCNRKESSDDMGRPVVSPLFSPCQIHDSICKGFSEKYSRLFALSFQSSFTASPVAVTRSDSYFPDSRPFYFLLLNYN